MEDETFLTKWKTWIQTSIAISPLLVGLGAGYKWADSKFEHYMPKSVSVIQHIDTQLLILDGHLRDYNRMIDQGQTPSSDDTMQYQLDMIQVQTLKTQKQVEQGLKEKQ